jgi:hypothetical protein
MGAVTQDLYHDGPNYCQKIASRVSESLSAHFLDVCSGSRPEETIEAVRARAPCLFRIIAALDAASLTGIPSQHILLLRMRFL